MHWLSVSLDVPAPHLDVAGPFWAQALGWELGPPWRSHPEFRSLVPPAGDSYAHVQTTGDDECAVHFDIGAPDVAEECERLLIAGATLVADFDIWRVLTSPGGLSFCLVPSVGETRPSAARWSDGHRSRLVQLCVDCPADLLSTELTFWREATGWEFSASTGEEFAGKLHPAQPGPVQLLFQRLGDDDTGGRVRTHIDLGTDDVDAEVVRLEALGAARVARGDGWVLLEDPTGMAFCATSNDPN